jgi:hypothetical protein
MRSASRERGRSVASSGLRKIAGPAESAYDLLIVDRDGAPVPYLTEWYRLRKGAGPDRTRSTYLDLLLPFAGYLRRHGYAWNADPTRIRARVRAFLLEAGCVVRPDDAWDGYQVESSATSPFAPSTLRVFLAALRDLYVILGEAGYYPFANPMVSAVLVRWKRERVRALVNSGAPDHAGIRGETYAESHRCPTAYFRLRGRGAAWAPRITQEPELQIQQLLRVVDGMAERAPCLRDAVVLRLLRETGARLHEVLGLTVGGYRRAGHPQRVLARNKGSLGKETKLLYLTPSTERLLHHYIRTERARVDVRGRRRLAELDDADPIFLTRGGRAYTSAAFRYHWRRLLARARQQHAQSGEVAAALTPHAIRHLHVTEALLLIRDLAAGDASKLENLQRAFQVRMAWRSPRMLEVYNLALDLGAGLETFQERYVRAVEAGRRAAARPSQPTINVAPPITLAAEAQQLLQLVAELEA